MLNWRYLFCFFFFKQKTAYEIPKRDWSSDVCSSDLPQRADGNCDGVAVRCQCMKKRMNDTMGMNAGTETTITPGSLRNHHPEETVRRSSHGDRLGGERVGGGDITGNVIPARIREFVFGLNAISEAGNGVPRHHTGTAETLHALEHGSRRDHRAERDPVAAKFFELAHRQLLRLDRVVVKDRDAIVADELHGGIARPRRRGQLNDAFGN